MDDRKKGIILILLSALFFASMAATVKFLDRIPVVEKIFFRNFLGLLVATYLIKKNKKKVLGNNKRLLIFRSIFGLLGVAAYFYALSNLPLADTVILNKMSPFFVLVLAAIFLGEKIKKLQFISLILAILGAGFVVKPEFDVSIIPYIIALLSAFFAGSAYTIIRHLRHTDSSETIVFYFTFISTVAMIPFMLAGQFVVPTLIEAIGFLGLGIFATTAQFLMTNAYRFAPAGELAIYTYTNIVFSTIIGIIIWSEIPDILSIIGGILIILAGFINYYSNKKKA
ncbi:MAG: DMT family transporter [Senegalia sp. (in: firmicutes)]|uniref:DMT family transporter n=1 Tax=Senegalia sp. (in: firmicutes) TaxID=1924098 RepID=UPI003F9CC95C